VGYIESIRQRLSPKTGTTVDEIGATLPGDLNRAIGETIPKSFWNLSAALYAYVYAHLARQGIDAAGESGLWADASEWPDCSILDWKSGQRNARYLVLKLIRENSGLGTNSSIPSFIFPTYSRRDSRRAMGTTRFYWSTNATGRSRLGSQEPVGACGGRRRNDRLTAAGLHGNEWWGGNLAGVRGCGPDLAALTKVGKLASRILFPRFVAMRISNAETILMTVPFPAKDVLRSPGGNGTAINTTLVQVHTDQGLTWYCRARGWLQVRLFNAVPTAHIVRSARHQLALPSQCGRRFPSLRG
jgi:hypothetical protein